MAKFPTLKSSGINVTSKRVKLEKANSQIFIATAAASFVIAFCAVWLNIIWEEKQFQDIVISERKEVLDQAQENIANIEELKTSFVNLENANDLLVGQGDEANSTVILDALPPKYDFPAVASSMDDIAKRSGVLLLTFTGDDLVEEAVDSAIEPFPTQIPFRVVINGSSSATEEFLVNLERSIRPMSVSSLNISGTDDELETVLEIVTHYQPSVNVDITTKTIDSSGKIRTETPVEDEGLIE